MTQGPLPHEGISRIVSYVPGWSKLPGVARTFKLASNESAIGPSPMAYEAAIAAMEQSSLYTDPPSKGLRAALSRHYDVDSDRLFCGAGSEDIIRLLACAYATTGDDILYTEHGFLAYPISARVAGANTLVAPETNLRVDVDAILATVTPKCKIVFIANPGNPTGTYVANSELERLRAELPPNVLLVLDSAYAEYVSEKDYDPGWRLVDESDDNVVMLRTFSKAYGLAGLRVGWAYAAPSVIKVLDTVRNQFNVTGPSQAAASAALEDHAHLENTMTYNRVNKPWLEERLRAFGFKLSDSVANFVFAQCPDGAAQCDAINSYLRDNGISVKPGAISGLADGLRITIGPREALELLVTALESYFAAHGTTKTT
jgi:histidinol-phosphate aminotransferase